MFANITDINKVTASESIIKGVVWHFGKYGYLLIDEKINTTLIF